MNNDTRFSCNLKNINIDYEQYDSGELSVTITTPRLLIRTARSSDLDNYYQLFANPIAKRTYGNGKPIADKETMRQILEDKWVKRWRAGDPLSALAILTRYHNHFIGHIVLGYNNMAPNHREIVYILHPDYWGQKYGTEAAVAVAHYYFPEIVAGAMKHLIGETKVQGLYATNRCDNIASQRILARLGFVRQNEQSAMLYGYQRYTNKANLSQLLKSRQDDIAQLCSSQTSYNIHYSLARYSIYNDLNKLQQNTVAALFYS